MKKFLVDDVYSFEYDVTNANVDCMSDLLKSLEKELMETKKATHIRFDFMFLSNTGETEIKFRFKRPERTKERHARLTLENATGKFEASKNKRGSFEDYQNRKVDELTNTFMREL